MSYKKGDACSFLLHYQVQKGSEFTHTSIVKPTGSFYIPSDKNNLFYSIYNKAVISNDDLYITEKHRDIGPIIIDLDFRFTKKDKLERQYDDNDIINIVQLYLKNIRLFIDIDKPFDIYVMQKPGPVIDKGIVKDGLHIVIPDIVTKPNIQYLIRKNILNDIHSILQNLELTNSYEDVIDEAVIERNNWQMYGSKKPNCERYKITKIFNVGNDNLLNESKILNDSDYVELLSIRNKYDYTPIKIEMLKDIESFDIEVFKKKKSKMDYTILQSSQNIKKNTYDNIDYVKKLTDILSIKRANKYNEWIRVGWCLRNIDYRLLDCWINFSQKSPKFVDGECEKVWNYMKDDGLGIGTLHMWAKQDNLEQYKDIIKKDLSNLILRSKNETHYDIASVIHYIYKYDYVCISIKQNLWYEFRNHRWVNCDSGFSLRSKVSTDICREYMNHAAIWSQKGANEDDEGEQQRCAEIAKKLNGISLKLKQTSFKDNIMKECRELFYVEKFEEKLDSRSALIGFENGVYDLETIEFREGRPEDYISFTTNINYIPYDINNSICTEINEFLSKVWRQDHIKEYVLLLLSSFLNGGIKEEKFHIWTGSGCFAKGTSVMMFNGQNKPIEDIKEGDKLMGDDSTPRTVQELFRGHSDMYKIKPVKGESYTVNGEHDLVVKAGNYFKVNKIDNQYIVSWVEYVDDDRVLVNVSRSVYTKEEAIIILAFAKSNKKTVQKDDVIKITVHQYIKLPKNIKYLLFTYRPDIVNFDKKIITLDPYLLGYWIGNDSKYDSSYNYNTADIEVIDYIKNLCKDDLLKDKHIPNDFKFNDKETRMNVLAGIVDSNGRYQFKTKQIEITLKSEKLIDDIIWLARSLGMSCYKSKIQKKCCYNGKIVTHFTTNLVGEIIYEIPVKIINVNTCTRNQLKLTFEIERVNDDNFYGFELDGNRRFLLDNFIVVKNSNGKSKTIDLFEQSFGDYCCKLPITLLTQKRAASNAATSELARTKGKRFACLQEPSEDEKLNVGLMKELTGGDKIMARLLYKEPIEFKPQFKMILTCNTLPNVPSDDGGTWRRIRVVEFLSKFCETPDPMKENEFAMDTELSDKFINWREYFMSLLIEYYKKYKITGIIEPEEVLKCTKEYQKNNDIFLEFIEEECERNEEEFVSYMDIFNSYKMWCKANNTIPLNAKKSVFIKAISKSLGRSCNILKIEGWKGWRFRGNNTNLFIDDLDK